MNIYEKLQYDWLVDMFESCADMVFQSTTPNQFNEINVQYGNGVSTYVPYISFQEFQKYKLDA